ncbi:MAG TPA: hypothetical protein VHZ25_07435 [Acidobacteriaceae bacterium]|nr:hypothetical protein [Acidobacteriaceae bacterium]
MSDPQPTTPAPSPEDLKNPLRARRVCQYIKTDGERCRANAVTGSHYCYCHKYNRTPTFSGVKGYDRVAFLEDTASIQLTCSQILQGLLDRNIDNPTARTAFYGLSVATSALRDANTHQRWLIDHKLPRSEQVFELVKEDGEEMAPEQEYRGPTGTFDPEWSVSKYTYEQECERAGQPKPVCAEDFPASGWLTEDEIAEEPADFANRYRARLAQIERLRKTFEADLANIINGPAAKPEPKEDSSFDDDPPFAVTDPPEPAVASGDPCPPSGSPLDLSAAAQTSRPAQASGSEQASRPARAPRSAQALRSGARPSISFLFHLRAVAPLPSCCAHQPTPIAAEVPPKRHYCPTGS